MWIRPIDESFLGVCDSNILFTIFPYRLYLSRSLLIFAMNFACNRRTGIHTNLLQTRNVHTLAEYTLAMFTDDCFLQVVYEILLIYNIFVNLTFEKERKKKTPIGE